MNSQIKLIEVAGLAFAGKDTFVGIAKKILERNRYTAHRLAFADFLKEEVNEMLYNNYFNIDAYLTDAKEKTNLRPLLVWWGCQRRRESNGGLYWVDRLDERIRSKVDIGKTWKDDLNKLVFLVSDGRFANEVEWAQKSWNGIVIHLKRWSYQDIRDGCGGEDTVKVYDSPPNKEETENDPIIQGLADYHVEWENAKKMTQEEAIKDPTLQKVVLDTLNSTKYFSGKLLK
jgi:hypothetical protein